MSDAAAASASRAFFLARFPEAADRLVRAGARQSSLVTADGVACDIRVGDQTLYGGDAVRFAADQVAAFFEKPLRLYMNGPDDAGLVSPVCIRLVNALIGHLGREGRQTISLYPTGNPSFLVVFGLGLGRHLEPLARRTEARWLILVEPTVEFIEHSFHALDWSSLVATFEARGGGVHVVTELDPAAAVGAVTRIMNAHGIAFADGSWVYTHYPLWAFAEARTRLYEALEFAFVNRGFFEDELRMMENAVENFATRSFALVEGRPRLRRRETAAIVGAGPSLDEGLAALKRVRDRVVLFSCGTALRPLLKNSIVPDFHCEIENVAAVYDAISEAGRHGDLSHVSLIASATVDPRVPPLFGETLFYFRDSVSSTEILGRQHHLVPVTSPTCVNMGLAMAGALGFTDFVLFGTDCGVRPGGKRHAEGTVYRDLGDWQHHDRAKGHSLEVEGNFGGVVHTDWVYDACRLMLAAAIRHYRFNVLNCSDGALIPGAVPCVPDVLDIAKPPVDRAQLAAAVTRTLTPYAPGALLAETDLGATRQGARRMFRELAYALDEMAAEKCGFAAVYHRITGMIAGLAERSSHASAIVEGALRALPRIGMFYGFRVADETARAQLCRVFVDEFRAILAEMETRTEALFAAIEARVEPLRLVRPAASR